MNNEQASVLIIYTGGTIGMVESPASKTLVPFDFENLKRQVPELNKFNILLEGYSFDEPIDSTNMDPSVWVKLARTIRDRYDEFDGFVVLHGSDTLAYTASALSFMLENLSKPVILTGAQLPIGVVRSDGKENLITSVEIAAKKENGVAVVPEVAIYFEYTLLRGNRTHKVSAESFEAFKSYNYPNLATSGVHIKFNRWAIMPTNDQPLLLHEQLDTRLVVVHLFPGIMEETVRAMLSGRHLRAIIMRTYGAGNAPTQPWLHDLLQQKIDEGVVILNVTQCANGQVDQGKYATGSWLNNLGVVGGADLTLEAAITKMMHLLGRFTDLDMIKEQLTIDLAGEISPN